MDRARAVDRDRAPVLGDGVSLVQREAVLRIDAVVLAHHAVALDLRHHRSRGHGVGDRIAAHHRQAGKRKLGNGNGVDHGAVRSRTQCLQRDDHRRARGAQDVALVDLGGGHDADRISERGAADLRSDRFTTRCVELLAVVHAWHQSARIDDHRGRHHRTRETAAPHLVDSGDPTEPALSQLVFETREQVEPERFGEQELHAASRERQFSLSSDSTRSVRRSLMRAALPRRLRR